MQRICRYCQRPQDIENFSVSKRVNGVEYRRHRCNACKTIQQNKRIRKIAAWVQQHKQQQRCVTCGNDDFRVLHFDHLTDKSFNLGDAARLGFSIATIKKEIEKCQVLCANCHAIKTYMERTEQGVL